MGAVWMYARALLRRRVWGTVAVALLVSLAGGTFLAAVAGARRTASSFDRFREESLSGHLVAELPEPEDPALARKIARLPGVAAVARLYSVAAFDASGVDYVLFASIDGHLGTLTDRSRMLAGRYANPRAAHEVTLSEPTARRVGLHVGDTLVLGSSFTPEQMAVFRGGEDGGEPRGPRVRLRVVGIERRPFDLTTEGQDAAVSFLTPAFYRTYHDRIGSFLGENVRIRLDRGAAGIPAFTRATRGNAGTTDVTFRPATFDTGGLQDSTDVLVVGLTLFAAIAGLAGLVAVAQALARQAMLAASEGGALRALGLARGQHIAALSIAGLPAVAAGVVLAVAGAFMASSFMPLGIAGRAEPHPGVSFDPLVLGLGGLGLAALVLGLGAFAAWRAVRVAAPGDLTRTRTPVVVGAVSRSGLGPPAAAGVRMALDSGRGGTSAPTRPAIVGTALAVGGVLAVVIFAASLDRLVATPQRFGWNWDIATLPRSDAPTDVRPCRERAGKAAAADAVEALATVCVSRVVLDGRPVQAIGFGPLVGSLTPTIVDGRAPRAPDEVALGAKTLRATGHAIGDEVVIDGAVGGHRYRIVGQAVLPTIRDTLPLGEGAAFTAAGLDPLDAASEDSSRFYVLRWAPGVDRTAAEKRFEHAAGEKSLDGPAVPDDVRRLEQVDAFPPLLGAVLLVLALLAVGHALVTGVRHRRRDLALLKSLGFTQRQVFSTVAWQASTIATLGILLGIPLGIATGRVAWGLVAGNLGVATDAVVGAVAVLVIIPAALVVANVVAALPARAAARTRPAVVLRAE